MEDISELWEIVKAQGNHMSDWIVPDAPGRIETGSFIMADGKHGEVHGYLCWLLLWEELLQSKIPPDFWLKT